jgi:hypothetical protein
MFEGKFKVEEIKVKKSTKGDMLIITLDMADDLETEKDLIEYRGEMVKVFIKQVDGQAEMEHAYCVSDVKFVAKKDNPRLHLVLASLYDKDQELEIVALRYCPVEISMELYQPELPLGEEEGPLI